MTKLIKKQTENTRKGKKFINYTDLMLEQFGLSYTVYFVSYAGIKLDMNDQDRFILYTENEDINLYIKKFEHPLITVMLFINTNNECIIKSISIRSRRDAFDMMEGINAASHYAFMHMKDRGIYTVKKPSSIRALINCRMDMLVHSVKDPELDLFELSLLQSKKSLVRDIQRGKVVKENHNSRIIQTDSALIHESKNFISYRIT